MEGRHSYLAYISYSSRDLEWAKWLQNELERYMLPTPIAKLYGSKHLWPIFNGVNDLSGGNLINALQAALDSSQYLIVICSPSAAKSRYVNSEIEFFLRNGKENFIIPVIVEGTPHSGDEEECFPESLRFLNDELLGINVIDSGEEAAIVKIVARLLNIDFTTLWDRYSMKRYWGISSFVSSFYDWIINRLSTPNQNYIDNYIPKKDSTKVFISYRRDDGQGPARAVQQALISKFGEEQVFFDFTSLEDKKFNLQILDAIFSCDDFVLVLSPKSMKKCAKKTDWVALEIRTAIKYKKHIIPINIDNKFRGWPKRFPKDLDELKYEQQLDFQMGTYFGASLDKLLKRLSSKNLAELDSSQVSDTSNSIEQRIMQLVTDSINKVLGANNEVFYKIRTNKEVILFVDGVETCIIEPNVLTRIAIKRGQYLITLKFPRNDKPCLEKKLKIENDVIDDLKL